MAIVRIGAFGDVQYSGFGLAEREVFASTEMVRRSIDDITSSRAKTADADRIVVGFFAWRCSEDPLIVFGEVGRKNEDAFASVRQPEAAGAAFECANLPVLVRLGN